MGYFQLSPPKALRQSCKGNDKESYKEKYLKYLPIHFTLTERIIFQRSTTSYLNIALKCLFPSLVLKLYYVFVNCMDKMNILRRRQFTHSI